jgi:hypothetical protein
MVRVLVRASAGWSYGDANLLATCSADMNVVLWDTRSPKSALKLTTITPRGLTSLPRTARTHACKSDTDQPQLRSSGRASVEVEPKADEPHGDSLERRDTDMGHSGTRSWLCLFYLFILPFLDCSRASWHHHRHHCRKRKAR